MSRATLTSYSGHDWQIQDTKIPDSQAIMGGEACQKLGFIRTVDSVGVEIEKDKLVSENEISDNS